MIFLMTLFIFNANAEIATAEVINILKSAPEERNIFLKNTYSGRKRYESFQEEKFIPAVNKMISILKTESCRDCLGYYFNALASLDGSANEEINEQLSVLLTTNTIQMNSSCKSRNVKTKKIISKRIADIIKMKNWEKSYSKARLNEIVELCKE